MAALTLAWAWLLPILASVGKAILRCKPCLIALALCVALYAAYWVGHRKATLICREAQLVARLANKQADLDEAKRAAADANARASAIEDDASDQRKEDAEYIARLKNRPACDLTDDDIDGLPNHRNRNGARPPRSAK